MLLLLSLLIIVGGHDIKNLHFGSKNSEAKNGGAGSKTQCPLLDPLPKGASLPKPHKRGQNRLCPCDSQECSHYQKTYSIRLGILLKTAFENVTPGPRWRPSASYHGYHGIVTSPAQPLSAATGSVRPLKASPALFSIKMARVWLSHAEFKVPVDTSRRDYWAICGSPWVWIPPNDDPTPPQGRQGVIEGGPQMEILLSSAHSPCRELLGCGIRPTFCLNLDKWADIDPKKSCRHMEINRCLCTGL